MICLGKFSAKPDLAISAQRAEVAASGGRQPGPLRSVVQAKNLVTLVTDRPSSSRIGLDWHDRRSARLLAVAQCP